FEFLGFALLGALVFNLAGKSVLSRLVMLGLNLAFFATFLGPWRGVETLLEIAPYAGFLAVGYAGVLMLRHTRHPLASFVFIVAIIAAFFWLKRYSFVPHEFRLSFVYEVVGLSYVFFRVLHLIIDVGQGAITERISPLSYLNYTLNFPTLVSGPIQ